MLDLAARTEAELNLLCDAFRRRGRVIIRDFLEPAAAELLVGWLVRQPRWTTVGCPAALVPPEGVDRQCQAPPRLSFHYDSILLFDEGPSRRDDCGLVDFLTSGEFVDLISRVTGRTDLSGADGHATRFGAGHHLNLHMDGTKPGEPRGVRRVAFVLGMTRAWNPDWGGFTLFPQSDEPFAAGAFPSYNQLLLFAVPTPHLVTRIAPDCPRYRYAISGWARSSA
ncbi:MAG: 2OG-Fe(II) oxygenase family protein [Rhizomicrobium sp.]